MSEPIRADPGSPSPTTAAPTTPTERFVADMAAEGAPVRVASSQLLFDVRAPSGALAGQTVETGVSVSEVQGWPLSPPHWVHLPESVIIEPTNSDTTDCPPGWRRHSRDLGPVDLSVPLARTWLRHVRGVLAIARTEP